MKGSRAGAVRARARRGRVAAWLAAGLGLLVCAPAASGDASGDANGDASDRETLPPGDVVDLVAFAFSKAKVRAFNETAFTLLSDFGPADVNALSSEIGLRVGVPVARSLALRLSAAGRGWFYDYDGDRSELAADLGGGDLFDRLHAAEFGLGVVYELSQRWSVFGEGRGKLSWEPGAEISDAAKGSGAVGIGYELDSRFSAALGVDVSSRIAESGVRVQPVIGFRWKIRDDMRLETNGIGLLFELDLSPEVELQLRARYETDSFLLDDRGVALGAPTLRERQVPLLVALRWKPDEHWRLAAGLGTVAYQKWRVEAEHGGESYSVDAGPAAQGWLKLEYRF